MRIENLRLRNVEVNNLISLVVPKELRSKMVTRIKGDLAYMNTPARKPDFTIRRGNDYFSVWILRRSIVVLWEWDNGVPFLFRFEGVTAEEIKKWLESL
ncbi:hypothetical protein DRN38_00015 [Thermococci archaeon]|nr:MAG: hypothetical protein DRN38_00015 [Thermococci archaeon]